MEDCKRREWNSQLTRNPSRLTAAMKDRADLIVFMSSKNNALAAQTQKLCDDGHYETEAKAVSFKNLSRHNSSPRRWII